MSGPQLFAGRCHSHMCQRASEITPCPVCMSFYSLFPALQLSKLTAGDVVYIPKPIS